MALGPGQRIGDDLSARGRLTGELVSACQQAEPERESDRLFAPHACDGPPNGGEAPLVPRAYVAPPAEKLGDHREVVEVHRRGDGVRGCDRGVQVVAVGLEGGEDRVEGADVPDRHRVVELGGDAHRLPHRPVGRIEAAEEQLGERQPGQADAQRVLRVAPDVERRILDAVGVDGRGEVALGRGERPLPEPCHAEHVLALDGGSALDFPGPDEMSAHVLGPVEPTGDNGLQRETAEHGRAG